MAVQEPADLSAERLDCLIVGGGPAGLTAAIYLARFHLTVCVIDGGQSRAALIPLTRNHAGFPEGVSGVDLLARMRRQAVLYGARLQDGIVDSLAHDGSQFIAQTGSRSLAARTVLLATGVVNRRPTMMDDLCHDRALATGRLRYCPICDGYEVTDKAIAVLGTGERGYNEAMFLRGYSADITLVAPEGGHSLEPAQCAGLKAAGIGIAGQCTSISLVEDQIALGIESETRRFDTLYPALGSDIRSELAGMLGASRTSEGCLMVDAHQRTDIPGLYAAGDVVLGLDQISHAMGEGGVAATTIRNDLAKVAPIRR
ncbi:thioredoxin reductase (NADPH) [Sphingobium sp. B7D2B]|uniref:NAD(P)/FAD-dependent oxidoreductase n=1 Tax=unclassified Sphingobium TaxID=2611147 RepID=UPI002223EE4F|nr:MULTISPECIES: NAD(P)/FAD-dependent oxidoreductase [unclassified Sphingobium]MCW2365358.1 thioredoxin reductase (NADPH) [Sphingobium sp. B7D2B]MCW2370563.1 thioredoxin reductase (NADPH) [Sphingobium sp. B11D3D]